MQNRSKKLSDYEAVVGEEVLQRIRERAKTVQGATAVHVNATNFGGGVAEILDNLVLLMNDVGVRTDWRVLHGTPPFFEITKKFHNALQGQDVPFSADEFELYEFINRKFSRFAILDHDFVIIHDPQPCALVHFVEHTNPWVWRCHIDITTPNERAWCYLKPFIDEYDRMVVSSEVFRARGVELQQDIVSPSIDPLSPKNMSVDQATIDRYLETYHVPTDKPLITQVSRFDPWKDPVGVLKVFERALEQVDCRLLYCYNMASDDPEGVRIYAEMVETARPYLESGEVLFVRGDDPVLVNILQRISDVVLQKSTREGFGLTITEAMWKGTPVIASNIGGIPTQMVEGVTGYLVDPYDINGCAEKVVRLLEDPEMAKQIGLQAKEHVRERFLITRHLEDYLNLMASL
jgi:trehalose synthase